jgi:alkylhydroperoxidase/carboxymuconolactone decarboxylase family protein YurZ
MLRWRRAPLSILLEFRAMDDVVIVRHLENLDRRLTNVEQILPALGTREEFREAVARLATKEELREAVALLATKDELREAVARLATKEELREAVARLATKEELREAVARLATKEELRTAIAPLATREEVRASEDRLRLHMDVVGEGLRSDIQLLAEHLASVMPKGTGS